MIMIKLKTSTDFSKKTKIKYNKLRKLNRG